jgi:hypothetical protein
MIVIPDFLINANARFVLVRPHRKVAFETEWQSVNNYGANDPYLLEHLRKGGNYGVLSCNGICQMDIDDPDKFKETGITLPASFTVTRGDSKRGHYYFTCSDCPSEKRDRFVLTFGDVRLGGNWYVVGPGCHHPSGDIYQIHSNLPFADVPFAVIEDIITRFGIVKQKPHRVPQKTYSEGTSWSDLLGLRCVDIAPPDNSSNYDRGVRGSHPFHGSKTRKNFEIFTEKNVWICRRHNTGGGALELYALSKGIIRCEEAVPGCLDDHWPEVFAALKGDGYDLSVIGVDTSLIERRAEIRDVLQAMGVL